METILRDQVVQNSSLSKDIAFKNVILRTSLKEKKKKKEKRVPNDTFPKPYVF